MVKPRDMVDFSGLDSVVNLGLGGAAAPAPVADGRPLEIDLDQIREDPNQPRTIFDDESLQELAASIKIMGVLEPISVRADSAGGYIINTGARRFRAAKMAGQQTIKAFVMDHAQVQFAQVVENIQRDNLKPMEIAAFIGEQLNRGKKQGEIAKLLGKSNAFVTLHAKLIDAPPWIMALHEQGVCNDTLALGELIKLDKSGSVENLQDAVAGMESISRGDVKRLGQQKDSPPDLDADLAPPSPAKPGKGKKEPPEAAWDALDDHGGADAGGKGKPKKEKEPNLEQVVYVGGRKGYLQTRTVEVYWDDAGVFEKIALKDLPPEAFE